MGSITSSGHRFRLAATLLIVAGIGACSAGRESTRRGEMTMRLDEAAHGSEVRLRLGQELEVVLAEGRTAGYRWTVVSDGRPVCRLEHDRFEPPPPAPGARGRHTWTFSAVQAGTAELELAYGRSFGRAEPARHFTIRVVAER